MNSMNSMRFQTIQRKTDFVIPDAYTSFGVNIAYCKTWRRYSKLPFETTSRSRRKLINIHKLHSIHSIPSPPLLFSSNLSEQTPSSLFSSTLSEQIPSHCPSTFSQKFQSTYRPSILHILEEIQQQYSDRHDCSPH